MSNPKNAAAMDDVRGSLCWFFGKAENTGSVSDAEFIAMTTLSLIDEYRDEIVSCDP